MSAWIETAHFRPPILQGGSRTLMSAWIETRYHVKITDDNICRTLMSAWIETPSQCRFYHTATVALS